MPFINKNLAAVAVNDDKNGPSAANCPIKMDIVEPGGRVANVQLPPHLQLGNIALEPQSPGQGAYQSASGDMEVTVPVDVKCNGSQYHINLNLSTTKTISTPNGGSFAGSPVKNHTQAIGNISLVGEIQIPGLGSYLPLLIEGNLAN